MKTNFEESLDYRILALIVLLFFYGIYFAKMFLQSKKGIRTHQVGTNRDRGVSRTEKIMSAATLLVVFAEIFSIVFGYNLMPAGGRFTGFCLGMTGNAIFLVSVCTMRDSWRAGIPEQDKTDFVSTGIYAWSRNPAFLGFDLMYTGVLLMFFNPVLLVFSLFAVISLHLQILQEEKFLEGRFGGVYLDYKAKVFRYLGRKSRKEK